MGSAHTNCIMICADSSSRKQQKSEDVLHELGLGSLKDIKRSQMLEDNLAEKLFVRYGAAESALDRSLSVIDEEGSQVGADENSDLAQAQ
mmetsp:Transcript_12358/g.15764  ORF Transcript_12358/g.15764 Transcript_12358/m.15764 type:complete len:90 (-) Transcript_12358:176-445(-)